MDPNAAYALLSHAVERLAGRPDMSGNDETIVESWRALDGWLAKGGFKPAAWSMHDRRTRPVRRDDATHPRELPNPIDEVQRELNSHPTWRPGRPLPAGEPTTDLQVNGERVTVPLSALDRTNPDGVTVWERGLGGESPLYYPPGMVPDSWRRDGV